VVPLARCWPILIPSPPHGFVTLWAANGSLPTPPPAASVLLDELDVELEERGHKFVRYADDYDSSSSSGVPHPTGCPADSLTRGFRHPSAVILCGSLRAGERILRSVRRFLTDKLKLTVNETKSRVVPLSEATFLGFRIVRRKVRWSAKSQRKFKAQVKLITRRTRGHSPKSVIAELSSYVRGAFNYYGIGIAYGEARELDQWLRRRVRLYYWTGMREAVMIRRSEISEPDRGGINSGDDQEHAADGFCVWGLASTKSTWLVEVEKVTGE